MNHFQNVITENRRLAILRILNDVGGSANDSILHTSLEQLGFRRLSRDTVKDDVTFLHERTCVSIEWLSHIMVASITARGVEVANGMQRVEGITVPALGG